MALFSKLNIEKSLVYFMTFFIFSGYYVGLTIILSSGNAELSRFYSVPLRIFQFLIVIVYIFNFRFNNFRIRFIDFFVFLFFLFFTLKVIYTELVLVKIPLSHQWYEYIFYFLFFNYSVYLFFRNINVKIYLSSIINVLLLSGLLLGCIVILFYRDILFASQVGRFGATIEDNTDIILSPLSVAYSGALNVSLLVPILLNNFKKYSKRLKIYYILNFLMSMFLFVMGSTRGAFVVVILSLLLYIFSQKGTTKIKYLFYLFPILPIFYWFLDATGSSLLVRISNTVEKQDSSGRDILWKDAFDEFLMYPIFGGKIEVSGFYPHNIILEILMGMGIVGILLFFLIVVSSMKKIKLNNDNVFLFIIFINGFFQYMFSGSLYTAIILFFAIGLFNGYKIKYHKI